MNHKKIKKQINKINSFFDSITDDDEISKIEKDLLLSYVRKLYESIIDQDSAVSKSNKEEKQSKTKSAPSPSTKEVAEPVVVRKPFERAEAAIPVEEEVVPDKVEVVKEAVVAKAAVVSETIKEEPIVREAAPVVASKTIELSEKMASIFEKSGVTEISDRLSSLPLKDLTKAMGINERMFTIKELFGGDQTRFKTTMSEINKLGGYEEAKEYLINGVATELEWDSEANYKKADKFVKLVQRRFS